MKKLDWESMGFSIAGYARNGVEALEMAEELQPDVVMTDIKMPYMDGLTLCKKLKELYQKVKVIIFSGFDEFEYAKEAIKIEAEEYILKPINSNELREVFERIRTNLDRELDEKRNIEIINIIIETLQEILPDSDPRKANVSKDLITYVEDRKGHDRRIAPDKIKAEIGWEPETMFKDGIRKTIAWYLAHEDWMNNVTSGDYQKYYEDMYKNK